MATSHFLLLFFYATFALLKQQVGGKPVPPFTVHARAFPFSMAAAVSQTKNVKPIGKTIWIKTEVAFALLNHFEYCVAKKRCNTGDASAPKTQSNGKMSQEKNAAAFPIGDGKAARMQQAEPFDKDFLPPFEKFHAQLIAGIAHSKWLNANDDGDQKEEKEEAKRLFASWMSEWRHQVLNMDGALEQLDDNDDDDKQQQDGTIVDADYPAANNIGQQQQQQNNGDDADDDDIWPSLMLLQRILDRMLQIVQQIQLGLDQLSEEAEEAEANEESRKNINTTENAETEKRELERRKGYVHAAGFADYKMEKLQDLLERGFRLVKTYSEEEEFNLTIENFANWKQSPPPSTDSRRIRIEWGNVLDKTLAILYDQQSTTPAGNVTLNEMDNKRCHCGKHALREMRRVQLDNWQFDIWPEWLGRGETGFIFHAVPVHPIEDFRGNTVAANKCMAIKAIMMMKGDVEYQKHLDNERNILKAAAKRGAQRIIKLYGEKFDSTGDKMYLILELGQKDLFQSMYDRFVEWDRANHFQPNEDQLLREFFSELLLVVKELHTLIIQSDFKPENMLYVMEEEEEHEKGAKRLVLKAIDFAGSFLLPEPKTDADALVTVKDLIYTPLYQSPEQVRNEEEEDEEQQMYKLSTKTDIWSLAASIMQMLLLTPAFADVNRHEMMDAFRNRQQNGSNEWMMTEKCREALAKMRQDYPRLYNIFMASTNLDATQRPTALGIEQFLQGKCQFRMPMEKRKMPKFFAKNNGIINDGSHSSSFAHLPTQNVQMLAHIVRALDEQKLARLEKFLGNTNASRRIGLLRARRQAVPPFCDTKTLGDGGIEIK